MKRFERYSGVLFMFTEVEVHLHCKSILHRINIKLFYLPLKKLLEYLLKHKNTNYHLSIQTHNIRFQPTFLKYYIHTYGVALLNVLAI